MTAKLRRKADQANVEFKDRVQQGDPAEIILLHARSLRPDVIVVGTHQRSGIDRFACGVRRRACRGQGNRTCPTGPVAPAYGHDPAVQPCGCRSRFQREFETDAVEQALALASDPGDRITLLHVVPGFSSGVPPHLYRYGIAE